MCPLSKIDISITNTDRMFRFLIFSYRRYVVDKKCKSLITELLPHDQNISKTIQVKWKQVLGRWFMYMFKILPSLGTSLGLFSMILVAVEKIEENYENMNLILSKIKNFDRIKFYIFSDMIKKLINIINGISCCAAKHPCPYCETDNH